MAGKKNIKTNRIIDKKTGEEKGKRGPDFPVDATDFFELASEYLEIGEIEKALENYVKAHELEPEDIAIHEGVALCFYLAGDMANAQLNFMEINKKDPDNLNSYLYLANIYQIQENENDMLIILEDGIDQGRSLLQSQPDNVKLHKDLSALFAKIGANDEAVRTMYKATRLAPDDGDAFLILGDVLYELNLLPEAIEACERTIRLDPNISSAYLYKGLALQKMNLIREALAEFKISLKLNPHQEELKELVKRLGKLHKKTGPTLEEIIKYNKEGPREKGKVRWFSPEQGIGFIDGPQESEVFLHFTAFDEMDMPGIIENAPVEYTRIQSPKGILATELVLLSEKPQPLLGKISEYDYELGIGFLILEDGNEVFFHFSALFDPLAKLNTDDLVRCLVISTSEGLNAIAVFPEESMEDDNRFFGCISWFDQELGNGIVQTRDGAQFLLYAANYNGDRKDLKEGVDITFGIDEVQSLEGYLVPRAINIKKVNN